MRALALFEWRYQTRRLLFALAALGFAGMCAVLVATGFGPAGVLRNGPWNVASSAGLLSLPAVFVVTIVVVSTALRDAETRMAPLVHAAPLTRADLVFGRFAGAMGVAGVVLALGYAVLAAGPVVAGADETGPFRPGGYLWAFGVLSLPNLLVAGALLYGVATLTRSPLATWVVALALYVGYFGASFLAGSPVMAGAQPTTADALARAAILDPFGVMAVHEQTRGWTPDEKSVRAVVLTGRLVANRALWLALAAAGLALVHARYRPDAPPRARRRRADRPAPTTRYAPVVPVGGAWDAFGASARQALRFVVASRPLWGLAAGWAFVAAGTLRLTDGVEYGTRLWPTAGLLLGQLRDVTLDVGALAIVYVGAELAWRDRTTRMAELLDATPAPDGARFAGRWVALVGLAGALVAIAMAAVVGYQQAAGGWALEPARHAAFAATTLVPLALLATAVLAVQALVPNRYVGLVAGMAVAVAMRRGPAVGLEHPALRFADAPVLPASAFGPSGPAVAAFAWTMAAWAAVAWALATAAPALAPRGPRAPLAARLAAVPSRLGRRGRWHALVAGAAALAALAGLVGATRAGGWESSRARLDRREAYERTYGRLEDAPAARGVALVATVALYPETATADVAGTLRLTADAPLDTVWVAVRRDLARAHVTLDGAPPVVSDARHGMVAFARRLAPGDTAALAFRVRLAPRGLGDADRSVVADGSYLTSWRVVPWPGYRPSEAIGDAAERRRRGLPARPPATASPEMPADARPDERMTLDLTVSTAPGQTAVAPGTVRRRWTESGRPHTRVVSRGPVSPFFAVASARYRRHAVRHRGVTVEVYAHPDHGANVPRMLRAATASLDVLGAAWGPYPHPTLRIAEVPAGWGFGAFALPGFVAFTEDRGFLTDPRDAGRLDLVSRRVAHEVAHQWWGHTARPTGPGAAFVTEAMAKDGEQLVVRHLHGEAQVARLRAFDRDRYASGRAEAPGPEPPLVAADESYLYYGRGAVVLGGLRALVGDAALDRALAGLMTPDRPVTAARWQAAVRAAARLADRPLVDDWTRRVTLYDLAAEQATARRRADGRWDVTVRLRAARTVDGRPAPVDETLDVGLYAGDPDDGASPVSVHAMRVRTSPAAPAVTVRLVASRRPAFVAVDPRVRRVDPDPAGHAVTVERL